MSEYFLIIFPLELFNILIGIVKEVLYDYHLRGLKFIA